jgi:hypothetical protein
MLLNPAVLLVSGVGLTITRGFHRLLRKEHKQALQYYFSSRIKNLFYDPTNV